MADLRLHTHSPLPISPVALQFEGSSLSHAILNYNSTESWDTLSLFLTQDDPSDTSFMSAGGRLLYKSSSTSTSQTQSQPHTTRVSRMYGRTAREASLRAAKAGQNPDDGLILAEMEWLKRTGSSRIRFGNETTQPKQYQQYVVDVRIDEFLKNTSGGADPSLYLIFRLSEYRSNSRMFATPDGRFYKWKSVPNTAIELVECANGRRVSSNLVSFEPSQPALSRPAVLHISKSVVTIIDQIIVSWVIIERERRLQRQASQDSL